MEKSKKAHKKITQNRKNWMWARHGNGGLAIKRLDFFASCVALPGEAVRTWGPIQAKSNTDDEFPFNAYLVAVMTCDLREAWPTTTNPYLMLGMVKNSVRENETAELKIIGEIPPPKLFWLHWIVTETNYKSHPIPSHRIGQVCDTTLEAGALLVLSKVKKHAGKIGTTKKCLR